MEGINIEITNVISVEMFTTTRIHSVKMSIMKMNKMIEMENKVID